MQIQPKQITLKDGTQAVLRSPTREDAPQLLDYILTACAETEFLLNYPEECQFTLEQEADFLQSHLDSPNQLMILCEVEGKVAGNCDLSVDAHIKTRHRGSLGIGIYSQYWGRGIGTALFAALIDEAKKMGLHQLELEYIEGNERGRGLYEKMGFSVYAEHPDAIRLKDGTLLKLIGMRKVLE